MDMKRNPVSAFLLAFCLVLPGLALAGDQVKGEVRETRAKPEQVQRVNAERRKVTLPTVPVYRPPLRGAPPLTRLVGGGTRAKGKELPLLAVLAPEHTGLTVNEKPVLYWYLSAPVSDRLELTVIDETAIKPLLEVNLDPPKKAGVQRVSLANYGIRLKPGVEYQWSIALVPDPQKRSSDAITSGTIQYIAPPQPLSDKLAQAEPMTLSYIYAEEGYWYDALASLSELIEADPADRSLREKRAALLKQEGLLDAADYDRKQR